MRVCAVGRVQRDELVPAGVVHDSRVCVCSGVLFTALRSGRTIGGSVWKISKGMVRSMYPLTLLPVWPLGFLFFSYLAAAYSSARLVLTPPSLSLPLPSAVRCCGFLLSVFVWRLLDFVYCHDTLCLW